MSRAHVVNLLNGAVSQYTEFPYDCITSKHAGSATGLYELDGYKDGVSPVRASIKTGRLVLSIWQKKLLEGLFVGGDSQHDFLCRVSTHLGTFAYKVTQKGDGISRCVVGKGTRANYIQIELLHEHPSNWRVLWTEYLVSKNTRRRSA